MAELIEIQRVEVGLENLVARVRIADGAPLMTSEDLQGTTRIYRLMPHIIEHTCLGDAGDTFKACMGNTELAHLLEHVTVELLAQTDMAGDITSGRTFPIEGDPRSFEVEISCKDDVLTVGALSSAVWMIDWAFSGGGDPVPDVGAVVEGLKGLVASLGDEPAERYEREVKAEIDADVAEEHARALEEREEQIAEREREIEEARSAAEEAARRRAQAKAARREAERAARAEAEAREAVAGPDDGHASPEAVQASHDLPDPALREWERVRAVVTHVGPEAREAKGEPGAEADEAQGADDVDSTLPMDPTDGAKVYRPEPTPERYAAPWEDVPGDGDGSEGRQA